MHGPDSLRITVDEVRTIGMIDMMGMQDYLTQIYIDLYIYYVTIFYDIICIVNCIIIRMLDKH